ncbi:MAG: DUF6305 family protein [Oscillospiraceae bacterium]
MKKLSALMLVLALTAALSGCGKKTDIPPKGDGSTAENAAVVEDLKEAIAEQPILLTSAGQSADVEMAKTLLTKAELEFSVNNQATGADIKDAKTLILAVGGSINGMDTAGVDLDQELERVKKLTAAAAKADVKIIAIHIGGEVRRSEISDEFIAPSFEKADYAVVVADGDKDGRMKNLASKRGVPIKEVDCVAEVIAPLKAAFK